VIWSPAVSGSKGGGDTMVVVGKGVADGAAAAGSRPGVGSGGLVWWMRWMYARVCEPDL